MVDAAVVVVLPAAAARRRSELLRNLDRVLGVIGLLARGEAVTIVAAVKGFGGGSGELGRNKGCMISCIVAVAALTADGGKGKALLKLLEVGREKLGGLDVGDDGMFDETR